MNVFVWLIAIINLVNGKFKCLHNNNTYVAIILINKYMYMY